MTSQSAKKKNTLYSTQQQQYLQISKTDVQSVHRTYRDSLERAVEWMSAHIAKSIKMEAVCRGAIRSVFAHNAIYESFDKVLHEKIHLQVKSDGCVSHRTGVPIDVRIDRESLHQSPTISFFFFFFRKRWIVQIQFFRYYLCTPNKESVFVEFGRYFWDTLYITGKQVLFKFENISPEECAVLVIFVTF